MLKRFAILSLSSLLLCSCTTVTPDKVKDEIASYDASTPTGYDVQNSGFIGFLDDGRGIMTPFGLLRYNTLVKTYKIRFKSFKGVDLDINSGIEEFTDKKGNKLYIIDQQHLVYYAILNSWRKDGKEPDSIWDKAKDLVK
jgi:hypothetical protein